MHPLTRCFPSDQHEAVRQVAFTCGVAPEGGALHLAPPRALSSHLLPSFSIVAPLTPFANSRTKALGTGRAAGSGLPASVGSGLHYWLLQAHSQRCNWWVTQSGCGSQPGPCVCLRPGSAATRTPLTDKGLKSRSILAACPAPSETAENA